MENSQEKRGRGRPKKLDHEKVAPKTPQEAREQARAYAAIIRQLRLEMKTSHADTMAAKKTMTVLARIDGAVFPEHIDALMPEYELAKIKKSLKALAKINRISSLRTKSGVLYSYKKFHFQ